MDKLILKSNYWGIAWGDWARYEVAQSRECTLKEMIDGIKKFWNNGSSTINVYYSGNHRSPEWSIEIDHALNKKIKIPKNLANLEVFYCDYDTYADIAKFTIVLKWNGIKEKPKAHTQSTKIDVPDMYNIFCVNANVKKEVKENVMELRNLCKEIKKQVFCDEYSEEQMAMQVVKIGKRNGICTFCGCENKKPLFKKHSHCKNCGKDLRW